MAQSALDGGPGGGLGINGGGSEGPRRASVHALLEPGCTFRLTSCVLHVGPNGGPQIGDSNEHHATGHSFGRR